MSEWVKDMTVMVVVLAVVGVSQVRKYRQQRAHRLSGRSKRVVATRLPLSIPRQEKPDGESFLAHPQ